MNFKSTLSFTILLFSHLLTYGQTGNTETGAVGAMGGAFNVSPLGGATYTIPISVPQGVGGMQPSVSIVYNSQSGNGIVGYGASLSGTSAITRTPGDIYHDGVAKALTYTSSDAFCLNGVRLIYTSGTAGQEGAVYNPESDPFTTVTIHGTYSSSNDNTWFEVKTPDGLKYKYGNTDESPSSRHSYTSGSSTKIQSWYLSSVEDTLGNDMHYTYQKYNNYIYPLSISYGTNKNNNTGFTNTVSFNYETRPDVQYFRFDAVSGNMDRLLTSITCQTNNTTLRTYTMQYDSISDASDFKYSRLESVTESNANNESLPPHILNWSYLPSFNNYSASTPSFTLPENMPFSYEEQEYISGDINGDGLDDIISFQPDTIQGYNSTTYKTIIYKCLASKDDLGNINYNVEHAYTLGEGEVVYNSRLSFLFKDYPSSSFFLDLYGDGQNELFIPFAYSFNGITQYNFMLLGGKYPNYGFTLSNLNSAPIITTGDINKDGRGDIFILESESTGNNLYTCHASRYNTNYDPAHGNNYFFINVDMNITLNGSPRSVYLSDMNGDGLNDLFVIYEGGYSIFWNHVTNQTTGISSGTYSDDYKTTGTSVRDAFMIRTGDFDGDGLMDILSNDTDNSGWYFSINNGNGTFTSSTAYSNMDFPIFNQSFTNDDNDKFGCQILDFDFDGKDDVIITKALYNRVQGSSNYKQFEKTRTIWLKSNGNSLVEKRVATSNKKDDALSCRYVTGDFDGDGCQELINYGYDCINSSISDSVPNWHLYDNNNYTASSGKVTSVTGDYGRKTDISYTSLTKNDVYTKGISNITGVNPAPLYTLPLSVVSSTTSDIGAFQHTTNYKYSGLKIHLSGRGVLGFTSVESENVTINTKEKVRYAWNPTYYIPDTIYSTHTVGGHTATSRTIMSIVNKGSTKYFAYPYQTFEDDIDNKFTYTEQSYNDTYGYLTSETVDHDNNIYTTVTYENYINAGGKYRPQLVTTAKRLTDDTSDFIRRTHYVYDSGSGLVTQQIENYQSSLPLTTTYTYDTWGNLKSEVSTGSGVTPLTKMYDYDDTHRFITKEYTTPASYVTAYTYDICGNKLTEQDQTDPSNDNVTTYTYDGWGNLASSHHPGSGDCQYSRGWNSESGKRYYTLFQASGQPWVKTWYDNMGREVATESVGPMNVSITKTINYDNKGQITSVNETNGALSLTSTYTYDNVGHLISETSGSGSTTDYDYSIYSSSNSTREITSTTAGKTVTKVFDAAGNLWTETDPSSNVQYYYSSNGNLSHCDVGGDEESAGVVYSFTYDGVGNKISFTDPDAGTSTYSYDALGRLISQTDGRGVVSTSSYDYLGRLAYTTAGEDTTFYTYGTSGNDKLRLISVRLSNGNGFLGYSYDEYGRVIAKWESLFSSYPTSTPYSYQYDDNGLLLSTTYPTGKIINNTYDSYGNLTGVTAMGGSVTWALTEHTGTKDVARIKVRSTGYPVDVTTEYDIHGYLKKQIMKYTYRNQILQSANYAFDASTGNLTSHVSNGSIYRYGSYTYDESDRLTGFSINDSGTRNITYDPSGNISSKWGIGEYTYDPEDKPHAVQSVDNEDGFIPDSSQVITYNAFGKVSHVTSTVGSDTYTYDITYGPDRQRWFSVLEKNGSLVRQTEYHDGYDIVYKDGQTTYYYYINGADGLAVVYTVHTQNGEKGYYVEKDHLGTIRALYNNFGQLAFAAYYDPWGKRELVVNASFIPFYRGFTGHEHIDELGLIDMNGRMYDPLLGRFLSPDPFIQMPENSQNFNRYSYCLNNPLKYTDPSGEFFWAALPLMMKIGIGIGTAFGTYAGYKIGEANGASGLGMVGCVLGGAAFGGISALLGGTIAAGGGFMANTMGIMAGSHVSSVGMSVLSGGKTDYSLSFGAASYNFTQRDWGYLGKEGNSPLENIGYTFGALANLPDVVSLIKDGEQNIKVNSAKTTKSDKYGHSSITDENGGALVSIGPDSQVEKVASWSDTWKNSIQGAKLWDTYLGKEGTWSIELNNVSTKAISNYASKITRWDLLLNSCVGHTTRSLWSAGVPTIYALHPHMLNFQLAVRQIGIYSSPYLYQIP